MIQKLRHGANQILIGDLITRSFVILLMIISTVFLSACTSDDDLPNEQKYISDTNIMMTVTAKLSNEPDAKVMHEKAIEVESLRVVTCADYNGECDQFGEFISKAISVSKDGNVSADDRNELVQLNGKIKSSIEEGRIQLHQAIKNRRKE